MTFTRALTPEKEKELVVEYEDGWTVNELSVIYKISIRTVYRILAEYNVPRTKRTRIKQRKPRPKMPRELQPCGTNAAYQRHKRKGEYPCTKCLAAHSQDVKNAKHRRLSKEK